MKIGQSVVLFRLEREGVVERAAIISELDEKTDMVHLTVWNRPIADCVMNGATMITTAQSVVFVESGPPSAGVSEWCNPVSSSPTLRAKIIKTPK
jgi:hypothetical protein